MSNQWEGLISTIQKFRESVKNELDEKNKSFHVALNGDEPLSIQGLGPNLDERNSYYVDISDVLFWNDPTAYIEELDRFEGQEYFTQHSDTMLYLEKSEQMNVFARLVESLKRKRIAPFIGAGLSRPCNYPLWGEAIKKLVKKLDVLSTSEKKAMLPELTYLDEVKQCVDSWNYLEAAQLIYDNEPYQMESFILNTFDGAESKKITGPITLLPQLADGCIVTTNFDSLIEKVFQEQNKAIQGYMHGTQTQNQFASRLIQGERCILKLHGHFDSPETYIFSESQYDNAYGAECLDYKKPLAKVLRQIFISHSLLFLGCSLQHDRTLELFMDIVDSNTFDIPEHFAFLPEPSQQLEKKEKENLLSKAKIRPIWYQVKIDEQDNQDHSQLESLLKFAIDCASGKARLRR
ncbi:SIR2 family protein [Bacillus sp. ISL-18]|uniref:SIR2 family NAD-dependent protein deacylase n=1 Tax=Bacillus sp. ISL-18 TaxID=2819118 RepID=UPI001BE895E1|nr:SIR2 family protein [Bacillus sp. ISL-18]MBT2655365.1 SIR2 family protein [Bacillus sp. ISL-18]